MMSKIPPDVMVIKRFLNILRRLDVKKKRPETKLTRELIPRWEEWIVRISK